MTDDSTTGDLYEQYINLAEMSFADEHFEAAYHALVAAMHTADDDGDANRIEVVKQMAREQITWLNIHRPNHLTGSTSAMHRGNRSIYGSLQLQADAMLLRIGQAKTVS
jgi:hypothetical protein